MSNVNDTGTIVMDKEILMKNKVMDIIKDTRYENIYTCYMIIYYGNECIKCRFSKVCKEISNMIND